jgi:hypothetical protein
MRRDVYIENDSGALSVIAGAAVDAIIDDARDDDVGFVEGHQALLLELYGDDSMPVRIVVDEPLTTDEEAQWLARATWRIDAPDGRLLVMGGFDPDVLGWWRDAGALDADGRGIGVIAAAPGSWRVDVYAHVGSMNGREVLEEAGEPVGTAFRRSHPGRPIPLWLANLIGLDGDSDPGHEQDWRDAATSVELGLLEIDTECRSFVGFLVHLTPFDGTALDPPEYGWFDREAGARVPAVFPLGLPASVPDPELEWLRDRILRIERPVAPPPPATAMVEIIETWAGDPARALAGGPLGLAIGEAFLAYWVAAMPADATPAWELWVTAPAHWQPPEPSPYFAVAARSVSTWAIGSPPGYVGWSLWDGFREAVACLGSIPDGTTLELATAPRDSDEDDDCDPAVGRTFFGGTVDAGVWRIAEVSPAVDAGTLGAALAFAREVFANERLTVRGPGERRALDAAAELFVWPPDELVWDGDVVRQVEPDARTLLLLAHQVFRARFAGHWPCDPLDADEADD